MNNQLKNIKRLLMSVAFLFTLTQLLFAQDYLKLNSQGYYEIPGLNVMVFQDFYPEGHQGGVSIIQNGVRVASNGDLRLEPTPGQWQPQPKMGARILDKEKETITVTLWYPDSSKNRIGFNPIDYPDLTFKYNIKVEPAGASFKVHVNLDSPLPDEWIGHVGFNLELFPGEFFEKTYSMDGKTGLFNRQLNGPMQKDAKDNWQVEPMAEGKTLVIAPESDSHRMIITTSNGTIQLLDGRAQHNNGWFVVRTTIPKGASQNAVEWIVTPNVLPNWHYSPVVQVSQVGYYPLQQKIAIIECDNRDTVPSKVALKKINADGKQVKVKEGLPAEWGRFVRFQYYQFDFSEIKEPGMYCITYQDYVTNPFKIDNDLLARNVWQPTLEYFLPVQMCHMRVNDRYRVWHGLCHMDDALMAPENKQHFDGYKQGPSTLTTYKGMEHVPGLDAGGWHDAGDYDLRVESQAGTVHTLSLAYELFNKQYDATSIDQKSHIVEMHIPDGIPDIIQQVEHGVLTIVGGYRSLGRIYRGIICQDLRQYVLLGDGSTMTDNRIYDSNLKPGELTATGSSVNDDRMVFTEMNPGRELSTSTGLAAAARVLKGYNDPLAAECLEIAETLYASSKDKGRFPGAKIEPLVELILTTDKKEYKTELLSLLPDIEKGFGRVGWNVGRVVKVINDKKFSAALEKAAIAYQTELAKSMKDNPYRVPYRPNIWGDGWNIQKWGMQQYFLYKAWPKFFPAENMLNALNFVLGCHPGSNTSSFASGVGAKSAIVAYGVNRDDWSYIPGGVISGTAYIRPDFPELKVWPYFWQQTEYVMGGGATNYMFLVLAAEETFSQN